MADAPCPWNEWLTDMTLAGAMWDDEPCCEEHQAAHWHEQQKARNPAPAAAGHETPSEAADGI